MRVAQRTTSSYDQVFQTEREFGRFQSMVIGVLPLNSSSTMRTVANGYVQSPHPRDFILGTHMEPCGLSCHFLAGQLDVAALCVSSQAYD